MTLFSLPSPGRLAGAVGPLALLAVLVSGCGSDSDRKEAEAARIEAKLLDSKNTEARQALEKDRAQLKADRERQDKERRQLTENRDGLEKDRATVATECNQLQDALSAVRVREAEVARREAVQDRHAALIRDTAEAQRRLHEAVVRRETARTDREAAGQALWRLDEGAERLRHVAPSGDWEIAVLREEVRRLTAAAQEAALRGAVTSYGYEAEVDILFDWLQQEQARLKLPTDCLPSSPLELLDRGELRTLEMRWGAVVDHLRSLDARFAGVFRQAVVAARHRLAAVRAALEKPQFDVAAHMYSATSPANLDASAVQWLAGQKRDWESVIRQRKQDLLKKALAIDGGDVAAHMELLALQRLSGGSDPEAADRIHRFLALERQLALRPVTTDSEIAAELLKNRFRNGIKATEYEAVLRRQWEDLKAHPDAQTVLGPELSESFADYVVSRLADADLLLLKDYFRESLDYLKRIDARTLPGLPDRIATDRVAIEIESAALERESRYRAEHHKPRLSAAVLAAASPAVADLLRGHAQTSVADVLATREGQQEQYQALTRLMARAGENPEAERVRQWLARIGYADGVADLAGRIQRFNGLRNEYALSGQVATEEERKAHDQASDDLHRFGARLQAGLNTLTEKGDDSEVVSELKARVKALLAALPPPVKAARTVRAASPFGDARNTALVDEIDRFLKSYHTFAEERRAAEQRVVAQREAERLREQEAQRRAEQREAERWTAELERLRRAENPGLGQSFPGMIGCAGKTIYGYTAEGETVYYVGPKRDGKDYEINGVRYRLLSSGVL